MPLPATSPCPPTSPTGFRLVGKQPPRRVITDFFKKRAAPYPAVGFPAEATAEVAT